MVIPVMTQHYAMLQRNLLYTGVTRGKRLVVLVGQKKAVAIAVRNVSGRRPGRSCRSGCVRARPSRGPLACRVDYGRSGFSSHPPIDWLMLPTGRSRALRNAIAKSLA